MNDTDKKLIYEFCGGKKIERFVAKLDGWRFGDIVYTIISDPDLNFYFKYAVPKLIYCSLTKMERAYNGNYWISEVRIEEGGKRYYGDSIGEKPDEAFGQALLKLIKEKK